MSDDPDNKIHRLPVKFRKSLPERVLVKPYEVGKHGCDHLFTAYIVESGAAEVTCSKCGAKLDPMWVLEKLASADRRMHESAERYQGEQKRLAERQRTKCEHCGRMTRISRR